MGSIGPSKASLQVGLISPYTGSNLGDQAIHLACIEQLQIRCPGIAFTAICLNPGAVARVHNVSAFPLSGLTIPFYTSGHLADLRDASLLRKAARVIKGRLIALQNATRWLMRAWRLMGTLDAVIVAGGGQIDDEWGGGMGAPMFAVVLGNAEPIAWQAILGTERRVLQSRIGTQPWLSASRTK